MTNYEAPSIAEIGKAVDLIHGYIKDFPVFLEPNQVQWYRYLDPVLDGDE